MFLQPRFFRCFPSWVQLQLERLLRTFFFRPVFPPGGGANTRVGKFLAKHERILFALAILILIVVYFSPLENKWQIIPFMVSPGLAALIDSTDICDEFIPAQEARSAVLLVLSLLLTGSFGHGESRARDILEGRDYLRLSGSAVGVLARAETSIAGKEVKYLGHLGDFLGNGQAGNHGDEESLPVLTLERQRVKEWTRRTSPGGS